MSLAVIPVPGVVLLSLLASAGAAFAEERPGVLRIPDTAVSLVPPAGFVAADAFPGFHHPETDSRLYAVELSLPAAAMRESFTPERVADRGMVVGSTETVPVAGREGSLFSVVQSQPGYALHKWILIFGTDETTVMITAVYYEKHAAEMAAPLRTAALSARWSPEGETPATASQRAASPDAVEDERGIAWYGSHGKVTERDLAAVEAHIDRPLPPEYRKLLQRHNGAGPYPSWFRITWGEKEPAAGDEASIEYFLAVDDDGPSRLLDYYNSHVGRIPDDTLAIAYGPGGDLLLLGMGPENLGKVFFWVRDREADGGEKADYRNVGFVADNLDSFLDSLYDSEAP